MWSVNKNDLTMAENDYGIALPVSVDGAEIGQGDAIKFVFKKAVDGELILEKEYTSFDEHGFAYLEFTAAESELFPVGSYVYRLDWYRNGSFLCNIITSAKFKVVNTA